MARSFNPRLFGAFGAALVVLMLLNPPKTLSAAAATLGHHGAAEITLPLEQCGNVVFVKVRVNGSGPLDFVLDSGAGQDGLDIGVAKQLNLNLEGQALGTGAGQGTYQVRFIKNVTIGLSTKSIRANRTVRYTDDQMPAVDFSGLEAILGRKVDGLLGYDLFKRFVVQIDYDQQLVRLFDPDDFVAGGGVVLPVHIWDGTPSVHASLTLVSGKRVEGSFMIDTGSQDSVDCLAVDQAPDRLDIVGGVGLGRETKGS
ncbi:MAG TPA: aspartyl protease family protein, partial [Blastocatellia bacterium]|nr:aspartyl protease family protein [Blastocatellia bacterium]